MKFLTILILSAVTIHSFFGQNLNDTQIDETTHSIPILISKNYVFKDKGKEIADNFEKLENSKKYLKYKNPDSLAYILSKDLKEISADGHMYVKVKRSNEGYNNDWVEQEKEDEIKENYGFSDVQVLKNNIGYVRVTQFMHPKRSMPTAVAAMKLVENTNALILDLSGNGGGYPGIMEYILNHYFDGSPIQLSTTYFADNTKLPYTNYTSDLIYGKLRVDTPLYVLIDGKTASASEYLAYICQVFGIGVIVGEKSAGAAHMNEFFELPNNFRISISTAAPIITKTNSNWEVTGVKPDYQIESTKSKEKALELINDRE